MQLKPEESSQLGLVAQFSKVKRAREELKTMVDKLSPSAKNVGLLLLGTESVSLKKEERKMAQAYEAWHHANVRIGTRRARSVATVRKRRVNLEKPFKIL